MSKQFLFNKYDINILSDLDEGDVLSKLKSYCEDFSNNRKQTFFTINDFNDLIVYLVSPNNSVRVCHFIYFCFKKFV